MRYRFADCLLDTETHVLTRDGQAVPVEPQVFDLLHLLVRDAGRLITYDAMIEVVWQGRIVSDATLSARVSAARKAVGDDGKRQSVIATVARRGIRLVVEVQVDVGDSVAAADAGPETGTIAPKVRFAHSADGTGIAYAVAGEGPPLLRGGHWVSHVDLDGANPIWGPLVERLGRCRRLARYDPRGTGLSEGTADSLSLDGLVDDMLAVADATGFDRFPIFAASQSAPVALALALRCPDRVAGIATLAGFARGSDSRGDTARTEMMLSLIREGWGQPESAFMRAFTTLFAPGATAAQITSLATLQRVSATPEMAVAIRQAIAAIDIGDRLAEVRVPVLVMHGQGDAVQPLSEGKRLAAALPDAELVLLDTANHIPVPQDPAWEVMMQHVDRFVARLGF